MSLWSHPFFAFGMFLITLATAIAFPEITLDLINVDEATDPFYLDLFKTGISFIAIGFLTLPLWIGGE